MRREDFAAAIVAGHTWLESNGEWKDASTPDFERYGPRYDPVTRMGDTEIWFPIQKPLP